MTFVKRSDLIDNITLHEAIKRVLNEYGSSTVEEITESKPRIRKYY